VKPKIHLPLTRRAEASALALHLTDAENSLRAFSLGEIDAVIDPEGKTYLLRPAQEQLRHDRQRLQTILDSVADVVVVVDRAGVIVSENHAGYRLLGYEAEERVGKQFFKFVHEDDVPRLFSAFLEVAEGFRANASAEFRHRAPDGSYEGIAATLSKLRDFSGTGVVCSLRRAAELPEPARKLFEAQPTLAKDRFLAILSHELRTPLNPVLMAVTDLLEDERFIDARFTLAMMQRNIQLQTRLIEEIADFAAIGQHKVRLRLDRVDLHEAIHFVLEICRSEITAAQMEIFLDLRAMDHLVMADSARIQQVMWNIVKNAIKFSPIGSTLNIMSTNDARGELEIEFTDQGMGIAPDLLPFIFDAFRQGDATAQHRHGGLGLGMYISKGLMKAHGGDLIAMSDEAGRGAKFRLSLQTVRVPS
jgi:PAS domain S-box-containing protein